jgi:hypothetical protein
MRNNNQNLLVTNTIFFSLSSKLLHCLQNKINKKGLHTANNPVVQPKPIPVKTYENADIHKGSIMKDNRGKAGIYR